MPKRVAVRNHTSPQTAHVLEIDLIHENVDFKAPLETVETLLSRPR
jgi:hypothetical protein